MLIFTVGLFALVALGYTVFIHTRMETPDNLQPDMAWYPELAVENFFVTSAQGNILAGYLYTESRNEDVPKGLVVLCHGLGVGGHITYIDVIDALVRNGYEVFAFDATGCDHSEGDGPLGFTQGIKDLDSVLTYVESRDELSDMPILLWGHSWGAWTVMAGAYYHPEVKGIAALSGYNKGMQPLLSNGAEGRIFGGYVSLYNRMIAGKAADITAEDGLKATSAPVLIAHGAGDTYISEKIGYDPLYEEFGNDPRFTFILREGRKHLDIYCDDETAAYRDTFENGMSGTDLSDVEADRFYGADSEMMKEIVAFYDKCIGE